MSLITEQKTPLIAEEDMVVYKLLRSNLTSIFYNFKYVIDKFEKTKIKTDTSKWWINFCSVQSKFLLEKYGINDKFHEEKRLICYTNGFHSIKTIELTEIVEKEFDNGSYYIHKFIIPKGSEYYEDECGFLVSNQIILKEQIK